MFYDYTFKQPSTYMCGIIIIMVLYEAFALLTNHSVSEYGLFAYSGFRKVQYTHACRRQTP